MLKLTLTDVNGLVLDACDSDEDAGVFEALVRGSSIASVTANVIIDELDTNEEEEV